MVYNITDSRKSIQHEHGILLSILHNDEAAHKKSFSQKAIKMTRLAADIDTCSLEEWLAHCSKSLRLKTKG